MKKLTIHKPDTIEIEVIKKKIEELVQQKPEKAAIILSNWINRVSGKTKSSTKKSA